LKIQLHQAAVYNTQLIFQSETFQQVDWRASIDALTADRAFTVLQALSLLDVVGKYCPFDRMEVAIHLAKHMMSTTSFEMVVDSFADPQERANLVHLLQKGGGGKKAS
jgi:hypothetical protein